jgi:hypothetical protein
MRIQWIEIKGEIKENKKFNGLLTVKLYIFNIKDYNENNA